MKSASDRLVAALATALLGLGACQADERAAAHAAGTDPARCASCHRPEFRAVTHPPHARARPDTCGVCHTQRTWHRARIEHPFWELTGAHARAAEDPALAGVEQRVKCFWCHRGEPAVFTGTPRDCVGCHRGDREGVTVAGHDAFPLSCETCHSTGAWSPAMSPQAPPPAAEPSVTAGTPAAPPAVASARPPSTRPKPRPTSTPIVPAPDAISHASRRR